MMLNSIVPFCHALLTLITGSFANILDMLIILAVKDMIVLRTDQALAPNLRAWFACDVIEVNFCFPTKIYIGLFIVLFKLVYIPKCPLCFSFNYLLGINNILGDNSAVQCSLLIGKVRCSIHGRWMWPLVRTVNLNCPGRKRKSGKSPKVQTKLCQSLMGFAK